MSGQREVFLVVHVFFQLRTDFSLLKIPRNAEFLLISPFLLLLLCLLPHHLSLISRRCGCFWSSCSILFGWDKADWGKMIADWMVGSAGGKEGGREGLTNGCSAFHSASLCLSWPVYHTLSFLFRPLGITSNWSFCLQFFSAFFLLLLSPLVLFLGFRVNMPLCLLCVLIDVAHRFVSIRSALHRKLLAILVLNSLKLPKVLASWDGCFLMQRIVNSMSALYLCKLCFLMLEHKAITESIYILLF